MRPRRANLESLAAGSGLSLDSGVAPRVDLVQDNTPNNLFARAHGADHAMSKDF
jgi:hypothetical protein